MSTTAQVIIGLLLLVAGLISVVAAVLGNPIRIAGTSIPGPNTKPARTIVAGIGTAALAACAMVFILGGAQETPTASSGYNPPPQRSADPSQPKTNVGSTSGSVGGLPPVTVTPTASPKPPAAPSTAVVVPGKPTVTSIKVSSGSVTGCTQTFHASVTVANPPATLQYVISVNGYVQGANPRTATVSGTTASLDDITVELWQAGEVVYNVLSPNLVSDARTWSTIPGTCTPRIGAPYKASGPSSSDLCAGAALVVRADLVVPVPADGLNVTFHAVIDGVPFAERTRRFLPGSTVIGDTVLLADNPNSYHVTVSYVITAPVQFASASTLFQGACYSPPPPTTDPPPQPTTTPPDVPTITPTTDPPTTPPDVPTTTPPPAPTTTDPVNDPSPVNTGVDVSASAVQATTDYPSTGVPAGDRGL